MSAGHNRGERTLNGCHNNPPELSIDIPGMRDLTVAAKEYPSQTDILFLTVEECEFLSCYAHLQNPFRYYVQDLGHVCFGIVGNEEGAHVKVALIMYHGSSSVPGNSLITVKNAASKLRPKAVISVGYCSGLNREKTKLGDVIVSKTLTTYPSKVVLDTHEYSTGIRTVVSRNFLNLIKHIADGWDAPLKSHETLEVEVHTDGEFLSGPEKISADWRRAELLQRNPQATAIETEGEGLFTAAFDLGIEWLLVKGIADFADGTDSRSSLHWKRFASVMAASVAFNLIKDPYVFNDWPSDKDPFDPTEIIENIRKSYKVREGRLAPFPWCEQFHFSFDDIYTRLKVVYRKNTRGKATERVVTMSEIFNPHEECGEPRTVLIEGKPGMGKTTYCKKVVFDWATGKHATENCFTNFLMVLLIKCRDVQSDLSEAIDDQLLPRDVGDGQRKRFFDFIRQNQSKVLLVLDGLDEVSEEKLPLFSEIIQGRVLPTCRVVATARHEAGVKVRKFCDTLLEVEGFTAKDAQSFITRFFRESPQLAPKLTERLLRDENLKDIAANPLNTALFCLVCEEFNGAFPESRMALYMLIVECVLRRYRAKKELPEIGEEIVQLYESQLKHLGWIALRGLHKDNLDFDEKELGNHKSSDLPGFGFLSVQPAGSKLRPSKRYAFLHKSFQEWFAAYHLSCQLQNEEISTDNIAADRRYRHQLKEVLLFTCGMLAQRCEKTAMTLMKSIATQLNQETERELAGGLRIVVECINECKNDGGGNLEINLAASFGSALQVKSVSLRSGEMNDDGAVILANVLKENRTVTNLNLSRNNIGDDGATGLAEALKSNVSLKELNLSRNKIGGVGAASLGEALNGETSLEVLDLRENKIGEAGFEALAEGLKSNSCLTKLSLFNNSAGDTGVTALAKGLKSNSSLKELYLFSNNLGDDGAAALADALSYSSCLTLLYLCRNRIGDPGAAALALCLKDNASLKELNLSQNNIGDAGVTTLAECLQQNTSLEKLYLNDNKISNVGVAADCFKEITKVVLVW
ncbi:Nucleotide-binding oligomerization domain-containing protein 2 [Stylophora pistillata]|uniref:Nucleotide-binding oligomerization domain-containing protein 2 n=1 Tax=Stylophora pistillata TaxID=50429 RepID=A0A2B4RMC8_STYPI|nr:Nucleotide-binding oligomerization domain-containing protein 2 [Stylophora pistillata]